MAGHVIGFGNSNYALIANELSTDVTVKGREVDPNTPPEAVFQKHEIMIQMEVKYMSITQNNVISWELKNITHNIVIDSGSWIYAPDHDPLKADSVPQTTFAKNIIYTTDCVGDVLRLRMWLPTGRTADCLKLMQYPNTFYS